MRRTLLIILLACTFAPFGASAEENAQASTIRKAGNALRFRVIKRFPPNEEPWPWKGVRVHVERGEWDKAWPIVQASEPDEPEFKFLRGYVAHEAGKHQEALKIFATLPQDHLLADYVALASAEAYRALEKPAEAATSAARVGRSLPIFDDASYLLALSLLQAGDNEAAERALRGFVGSFPNHPGIPVAKTRLARLLEEKGEHAAAAYVLVEIVRDHPRSREATSARDELKRLSKKLPKDVRARVRLDTPEIEMALYRALFKAHRSDDVVDKLGKRLEKYPKGALRCEALYMVGRSLTKLRKHSDSVPWYTRVRKECPGSSWELKALYMGGKGLWNAGKKDDARAWFEEIWTKHSGHSFADDAMYFASRILREDGEVAKADALLDRQLAAHPTGDMAKDAHWLKVREDLSKKRYAEVVTYVDGLSTIPEDDVYSRGRLHYFRARALELSGKAEAAKAAYRKVANDYPLSHYALFALNRLFPGDGPTVCTGKSCGLDLVASAPPIPSVELQEDPRFKRASALLRIELATLARPELAALRRSHGAPEALWALAELLDEAGAYPYSHDIPRRQIEGWQPKGYPQPGQSRRWEITYPRPFLKTVTSWTKQRAGVDMALTYAIMREESGFSPSIESWANARGLMQLMEGTASRIAEKDGLKSFDPDTLFTADVAIRLGTAYLDELASQLDGHPSLVIAGYNGGMGNVGNWLASPASADLDLWIEDIPFGQTRKYAKRVLQTYWTYRFLYEDGVVPRVPMQVKRK